MELTIEDRVALRALVDAYAGAVDAKDPEGVARLFLPDGRLIVPDPAYPGGPPVVRRGTDEIVAALERLHRYRALVHVVGGQVVTADAPYPATGADAAPKAVGVTTCLAHHVAGGDGATRLLEMGIHYHDTFGVDAGNWRFAERRLEIAWREDRLLGEGAS